MSYPVRRQRKPKGFPSRTMLIALCGGLGLILAILLGVTLYAEHLFGKIERVDPTENITLSSDDMATIFDTGTMDPTFDGATIDPTDVTWATQPTEEVTPIEDVVNILLIGTDGRYVEERGRSDSIILCTFNTRNKKITLSSLLRDLYVQIPGQDDNRINAAYALGGMKLLKETVEMNFGVHVDACVTVNFFGFPQIVDTLGGIEIELTKEEADYLNAEGNWNVPGGTGPGVWQLVGGVNKLNGEQALAYSRIRDIGADFGRSERQRKVLTLMVDKCKSMNLTTAMELVNTFLPLISTDMTNQQIVSYARTLFPMLSGCTIASQRLPYYGAYTNATIRGMQVLLPDLPALRANLSKIMAEGLNIPGQ